MITVEELLGVFGFTREADTYACESKEERWGIHAEPKTRFGRIEIPPLERFDQPVSVWLETPALSGWATRFKRFDTLAELIATHFGPDRIMIDEFEGRPPKRVPDLQPVIIFIRDDGWMLGAPAGLEQAARRMWAKEWIAVIRKPWKNVEVP